jgi:hypothetical protein
MHAIKKEYCGPQPPSAARNNLLGSKYRPNLCKGISETPH